VKYRFILYKSKNSSTYPRSMWISVNNYAVSLNYFLPNGKI